MPSDPLQKNLQQIQIQTETQRRERCPRCESVDTKFCYYNNYNTSQPRHFCRSCRRYWTLGGSLRSVPVGGSTRVRRFLPYPKSDAASTAVTPLPNHIAAGPFSMGFDIRPMNVAAGREYAWPALSLFTEPSKAEGGDGTERGQAH